MFGLGRGSGPVNTSGSSRSGRNTFSFGQVFGLGQVASFRASTGGRSGTSTLFGTSHASSSFGLFGGVASTGGRRGVSSPNFVPPSPNFSPPSPNYSQSSSNLPPRPPFNFGQAQASSSSNLFQFGSTTGRGSSSRASRQRQTVFSFGAPIPGPNKPATSNMFSFGVSNPNPCLPPEPSRKAAKVPAKRNRGYGGGKGKRATAADWFDGNSDVDSWDVDYRIGRGEFVPSVRSMRRGDNQIVTAYRKGNDKLIFDPSEADEGLQFVFASDQEKGKGKATTLRQEARTEGISLRFSRKEIIN